MKKLKLLNQQGVAGKKIEIGTLEYIDNRKVYVFTYADKDESLGYGDFFWCVPGISRENKTTESERLFWFFADRIPSRRRKDISMRLERLGLQKYDEWNYIESCGLKTATDKFELVKAGK